jgi:hypothetical protein
MDFQAAFRVPESAFAEADGEAVPPFIFFHGGHRPKILQNVQNLV